MHSSPDDLRRQMLTVVFGWTGDIEDLIKDEFGRHAAGTQNAAILARWLAHLDPSIMTSMIASGPSSFDWMLLALSQLDNQTQNKKLGQEFVQKLLAKGDIHGSAAVLLGLGEHNDAIEVYVSRCQFMEAILMTCLVMPIEWERQSYLVRKWGEHVVQNSQQHLAIRCFSCTNGDLSEPWALSTAQMTSLLPTIPNLPETGSDSASKTASKNPALKLITSFSPNPGPSFRFPGLVSADRTPTNGPGVTPIAESATVDSATRSPGMGYYYRQNSGRTLSARTTTPVGFTKQRLSSIGETPIDVASPRLLPEPRNSLPTPAHSGSEREKDGATAEKDGDSQKQPAADEAPPTLFLTSARYDPTGDAPKGETPQTAVATAKGKADWTEQSASPGAVRSLEGKTSNRNSSRDRNPEGLHIQWPPADPNQQGEYLPSTMRMSASFANYGSNGDHGISPALTTDSNRSARSASASVRSIDQYISSLDEATYYSRAQRPSRSERRNADTTDTSKKSHKKQSSRASSKEARGRSNQRYIQPAKRSPSSPIPMSPEDLALYTSTADTNEENARTPGRSGRSGSRQRGGSHRARAGSMSQVDNRGRSRSNTRPADIITTRGSSRNGMRQHSPEGADFRKPHTTPRGRSRQKEKSSGLRSPSSPLPMSPPDAEGGRHGDVEDSLRLVNGDRKQRLRSQQRNQVRRPERGTSARRDVSPDRRRERDRSQSRSAVDGEREPARDFASDSKSGHRYSHSMNEVKLDITDLAPESSVNIGQSPLNEMSERSRKELAAAELEARRLSLARRPSAPAIPMPGEFHYPPTSRSRQGDSPVSGKSFSQRVTGKSTVSPAYSNYSDTSSRGPSSVPVGLPATPRAMRHPKYSTGYHDYNAPAVPDVPDNMSLHDQSPRNIAHATSRSMSAPIPDEADMVDGVPTHPHFHRQLPSSRISKYSFDAGRPSPGTSRKASIDQAMEDSVSPTTNTTSGNPPLLPELQHLQAPPPPPPAPPAPPSISTDDRSSLGSGVGTINIAMEDPPPGSGPSVFGEINVAQRPATTSTAETAPASGRTSVEHRRGRSVNENISSKLRSLTTRMRSTSRGANSRSPSDAAEGASPYESVSIVRVMDNKL